MFLVVFELMLNLHSTRVRTYVRTRARMAGIAVLTILMYVRTYVRTYTCTYVRTYVRTRASPANTLVHVYVLVPNCTRDRDGRVNNNDKSSNYYFIQKWINQSQCYARTLPCYARAVPC